MSRASPAPKEAIAVNKRVTGCTLNRSQHALIQEQVRDTNLWLETLDNWSVHDWNPRNIDGQLEFYQLFGSAGCHHGKIDKAKKVKTPQPSREELRKIVEDAAKKQGFDLY